MKKLMLLASILFLALFASANNSSPRNCATMEVLDRLKTEDPDLLNRIQQIEAFTNNFLQQKKNANQMNAVISIPVVFHVVYSSTAQNISDAICQAQLDQLNLDFARMNSNASSTPSVWQGISANTNIQFCLAKRDPNGNATTGIERRQTTTSSFSTNDNIKRYANGGLDAWPSSSYLNIWSGNLSGGVLGYAQFPGGSASTDGVVLLYSSLGSVLSPGTATPYHLGRTATHEVGHWLNLRHIWGDESGCTGSDLVGDTPNQGAENYGCPSFPKTDACSSTSPGVMFMNYMDYTDDACMNMFTTGQSDRMNALFASGGTRVSLLSSLGCQAPTGTTCSIPANLTSSSVSSNSATLSWSAVNGAISYNVQYKTSASGTWTTTTSTTNSKSLTGLAASTVYNFQVQTICSSGSSAYSTAASFTTLSSAVCGIPSGLAAASVTSSSATLSWTAVSGATSYNVQYKTSASSTWTTTTSTTNSKSLTGLAASTVYNFQVQTVCSSGSSAYSSAASFTTLSNTVCGTPSGLAAASVTSSSATLSWTAVSGATSYNVQYKTSASSTWTTTTSTTNSKALSGLVSSTVYNFQVQTVCASGSSAYSTASSFTTGASGCSDIYESNNTSSTAKTILTNVDISALIGSTTDADWFKFTTVSPNTKIKITLNNLPGDYDIRLYNSSLSQLAISQNGGTTSETIIRNTTSAATYYIKVYGYSGANSSTQCYALRVNVSGTNFRTDFSQPAEEITSTETFNEFIVYPNPVKDFVYVSFNSLSNESLSLRIFDLMGRTVRNLNQEAAEGLNKFSIDLNGLVEGVYFVEMTTSSGRVLKKIVLEN